VEVTAVQQDIKSTLRCTLFTLYMLPCVALPGCREAELLQQLSDLRSELAVTATQVTQQHATQQQLHAALEAAEAHAEIALQRAAAAEAAAAAETARSAAAEQQHKQALQEAKKEQQELLKQQQSLMDVLAQRDQRVSAATYSWQ
jgi:preprotein translocase subunit SecF